VSLTICGAGKVSMAPYVRGSAAPEYGDTGGTSLGPWGGVERGHWGQVDLFVAASGGKPFPGRQMVAGILKSCWPLGSETDTA
jgi:hypothetical protein